MEPIRRGALVEAAIHEIGAHGALDVTVAQIARRAGMSTALAHHYFGSKEAMFAAAMRHVLTLYGAEVRGALSMARGPRQRVEAIIRASFTPAQFRPEMVAAWLNFYVQAQRSEEAALEPPARAAPDRAAGGAQAHARARGDDRRALPAPGAG
jgi:TetR/AcrR family transcriptional repressor of bet genes